ncbi:complex I subunit 5 family protein [Stutzerimonas balearica]|uniref:complex I subunit 5 family protein n=1 Tax=Stutzerimonas balearica TaxID=74829 RepID=UPI00190E275D|nr:complex I subunit 5 family protein [Stutzerimonas balearica]MBK3746678.1 sodium:proton antiporter [Stutzerimonas balearica]MBK3824875.1 sodium:proton antiporter [Stutzerimonas balearica]MBK3854566.1 sodium:proton antiporter [Stutzerimonas balearica]
MNAWLWLLVPLAPLLAAALLPWLRERLLPLLPLTCLPGLLAALQPAPALELPWLWEGVRWGGDDLLTRAWLGFSAVLWAAAAWSAVGSLAADAKRLRFWLFWQLALAGNLLLIVATDALSFYLGFSAMSLAAYGLIAHHAGPRPRRAARLYLQLALCGEMLLLAGLLLRSHATGQAFDFASWQAQPIDSLSLGLLLVGLGLKAGFWPLHVWLPLAHPEAPAPASAVLSGAMLKAGVLGLWRCLPAADPTLAAWSTPMLLAGLFGAFYAAALGLCASKPKAVLAWSSVSQMGWLLMILALAWGAGAPSAALLTLLVLFGVHHGLAKGALFLAAGLAHDSRLTRGSWLVLWLPALAIMGAPLTSGAAVKYLLKDAWHASPLAAWGVLLALASVATALLLLRALWLLRSEQRAMRRPAPRPSQWLPWALLSLAPVVLPWVWSPLREPLLAGLYPGGVWAALWPLLAALGLAALALQRGWRVPRRLRQLPNPAQVASLRLTRLLRRPPLPEPDWQPDRSAWRRRERHWNRWLDRGVLAFSAWLLALLLWLGWLW